MNARVEQKEQSRAAILASAAKLLRQRGIGPSSVLDVMKGAGLTVGGFYGHFDSKEALFTATIKNAAREKWDALIETAKGSTGVEKVLDVVKKYVSRSHRDQPDDGCLLPAAIPDASRDDGAAYREAMSAEVGRFVKSIGGLLDGDREKALGTIALMYGALALSRGLAGTALSDEVLVAARRFAEKSL